MHPVLFEFDLFGKTIRLYSFGLVIVLAFLAAAFYARRRAVRTLALDRERVFNVAFALLFVGLAGARLLHVFVHYATYAKEPLSFLYIWDGGMSLYGGLIGGLLWLAWFLPRHPDLKGFALADVFAVAMSLAVAIGSLGSFLSGDSYGKPTDLAWGIAFPHDDRTVARPRGEPLHPTQLYHSLHGLLMFLALALYLRGKRPSGRAVALFLALYAVGRSVIEIWRGDDDHRGMVIDGVLSVPQLLSIPFFFAGVAIWLIRKSASPAATAPVAPPEA